jgi:uncharacterized protein YdiU (UPF0061 family)
MRQLVRDLLQLMAEAEADFTGTFRALSNAQDDSDPFLAVLGGSGRPWLERWQARLGSDRLDAQDRDRLMRASNPAIIPRNHRVEAMIEAALSGDFAPSMPWWMRLHRPMTMPLPPAKGLRWLSRPNRTKWCTPRSAAPETIAAKP